MATIFYLTGAIDDDSTIRAGALPAADIALRLKGYPARRRGMEPFVDPDLPFSGYWRDVVVKVDGTEVNATFLAPGYYQMVGLTPTKCRELLDLRV